MGTTGTVQMLAKDSQFLKQRDKNQGEKEWSAPALTKRTGATNARGTSKYTHEFGCTISETSMKRTKKVGTLVEHFH
jgi:hypothetical protein